MFKWRGVQQPHPPTPLGMCPKASVGGFHKSSSFPNLHRRHPVPHHMKQRLRRDKAWTAFVATWTNENFNRKTYPQDPPQLADFYEGILLNHSSSLGYQKRGMIQWSVGIFDLYLDPRVIHKNYAVPCWWTMIFYLKQFNKLGWFFFQQKVRNWGILTFLPHPIMSKFGSFWPIHEANLEVVYLES